MSAPLEDLRESSRPLLRVEGLSYSFETGANPRRVLDEVNLKIQPGEIAMIMGPSGSGKTTFLSLMGASRPPQDGVVLLGDRCLSSPTAQELVEWRRHIGFLFQFHNLIPSITACENVQLPLLFDTAETARSSRSKAVEALRCVGLADFVDRFPRHLSGGQKQRVAIARAIVRRPALILADEPTASLDKSTGHEVADLLHGLSRQFGCTILIVTHDHRILDIADRVLLLEDGHMEDLDVRLEGLLANLGAFFQTIPGILISGQTEEEGSGTARTDVKDPEILTHELNELSHFKVRATFAERIDLLQQLLAHTRLIQDSVQIFARLLATEHACALPQVSDLFFQALEALLLTTSDVLLDPDPSQAEMLRKMTQNQREIVARVRDRYLQAADVVGARREFVFEMTDTFTRTVYLLNSLIGFLSKWRPVRR